MDWIGIKEKLLPWIRKYRYVLLVLAVGFGLMLLPTGKTEGVTDDALKEESRENMQESLDSRLMHLLSQISGVGDVQVLLSIAEGEETLYQTDSQISQDQSRVETVLITGADRAQAGLIKQVKPPVYRGAVVVCKGGDKPSVRLAVVEAVSSLTGLGADQISVLKMK